MATSATSFSMFHCDFTNNFSTYFYVPTQITETRIVSLFNSIGNIMAKQIAEHIQSQICKGEAEIF